jgi:AcrR family transcriptional regulator
MTQESVRAPDPIAAKLEELRRMQILDAAARVFAEKGFRSAKVQEVARAAGVAHGTVYNYFPSKEELLLALLDRLNETEQRAAQLASVPDGNLAQVMRHRLRFLRQHRDLLLAVLPEVLSQPALRQQYLDRVVGPSFALAEEALARLGVPDPARVARATAAGVLGVVVLDLLGEPGTRGDEAEAVIARQAEAFEHLIAEAVAG